MWRTHRLTVAAQHRRRPLPREALGWTIALEVKQLLLLLQCLSQVRTQEGRQRKWGWGGGVRPWASSSSGTSIDNKVCFGPSGRSSCFFLLSSATGVSTWQAIWAVCCDPPLISPGLDYWIFRVHCFAAAAADETSEVLFDQYQLEHKTAKLIFPPSVATLLQWLQHKREGPMTARVVDKVQGTLSVQEYYGNDRILHTQRYNNLCTARTLWLEKSCTTAGSFISLICAAILQST